MKSLTSAADCVGVEITKLFKHHRRALRQGMGHNVVCYNHHVGNNIGMMKFAFKVESENDEGNKLIGIASCEENVPKVTTRFYKRQIKNPTSLSSKSKLMSANPKASFHIKVLAEQSNATHTLSK